MSEKWNLCYESELVSLRDTLIAADSLVNDVETHAARMKLAYAVGKLDAYILDCIDGGDEDECDDEVPSSVVEGGSTPPASTRFSQNITCGIEPPTDPAKGDIWIYHPDSPSLTEWECRVHTGNQWAPIMSGKEFKEMIVSCETPAFTSLDDLAGTVGELRRHSDSMDSSWLEFAKARGERIDTISSFLVDEIAPFMKQLRSDVDNLFTDHAMTSECVGDINSRQKADAMRLEDLEELTRGLRTSQQELGEQLGVIRNRQKADGARFDDLEGSADHFDKRCNDNEVDYGRLHERISRLEASVGNFGNEIGTPEGLAGTLAELGTNVQRLHSQVDVLIARVGELEVRKR